MFFKFSWQRSMSLCSMSPRNSRLRFGRMPKRSTVAASVAQLEPRQMLTTIDLATLTAAQGTTIFGADALDSSGHSVSSAGDVNGDGFDDLLIGAREADASGNAKDKAGESYVVFGGASMPATIDLANLGSAGITIFGADAGDQSGGSVSSAGDVNGDGFDDLLIGASWADASGNAKTNAGDSYVIFGGASLPATIDLANLGSAGITIFGADAADRSGSVSNAGDVNGDGFDDLLIGAFFADASGNVKSGAGDSYLIFGAAALPATIDLANLGAAGITIFGADAGDFSGSSVSSAGDVNGDGFDDLVIGAFLAAASGNAKSLAGESYVIFGGASLPATIDLATLGSAGITIFGADADDRSGISVSGAGDVNGDGFDDLLIGAVWADASGDAKSYAGDSYVIFGGESLPATIDLANLGSAGITIFGADEDDRSGFLVSSAGDVNGDGFDDLLVGASGGDASGNAKYNAGDSYVIFGGESLPATIDLATLGSAGITIFGADASDQIGGSVSSAGDVNGDGFDDLLIGAHLADASGNLELSAGESYVIFGGNGFTSSVTHPGTAAAETLTGTAGANLMVGGRENDTLLGTGGADVLIGGQGNDVLAVGDLSFQRIVGGTGSDTLQLDGSGLSLNLTTLHDNRLLGIETIDITGSGNNTLILNKLEVLNLSDESNTLIVLRNAGDVVDTGSGWTPGLDQTIGLNNFNVFTQGAATLLIQEPSQVVDGTSGNDAFVLTYSGSAPGGSVAITISTDGGPVTSLGAFPMNLPLTLNGLGGTDSVRIVGTTGNDTITVTSSGLTVNGAGLVLSSIETRTLAGVAGNDTYKFDADEALGLFTLSEAAGGIDTIDFSLTTTVGVSLNLSSAVTQVVHSNLSLNLSSGGTFENIIGGSGNDILTGNTLNNTLNGGAGNETYVFNTNTPLGSDTVTDSAGSDYLYFVGSTNNVTVNLGLTTPQVVNANLTLTLASATSIEHIFGGSGNDTLTGNSLNNTLNGYDGDDVLSGGDGNDTLNGGAGADTLDGGDGNDALNGGAGADALDGGDGNDTLYGESGNDTLVGGAGNETYVFNTNTPLGSDTVTDSAGNDYLYFVGSTSNLTVNISLTTPQVVNANLSLTLASATSIEHIYGGSGNDTLTGNSLNNTLNGYDGDDVLSGGDGNDTLNAGAGNDTLVGGAGNETYVFNTNTPLDSDTVTDSAGNDYLYFVGSTNDLTVNLGLTTPQVVNANLTLTLASATSIEHIFGGSGNDTLIGNSLNNTLNGYDGNDVLSGGDGNDTLNGGAGADALDGGVGNDKLYGESGNDTLVGGAGNETYVFNTNTPLGSDTVTDSTGNDYLYFVGSTNNVTVNLSLTTPQVVNANLTLTLASATSIEHIYGGSGNDTLTGNTLNNTLNGYDGDDVLSGGDGNDTLNGGGGKNILIGGNGVDLLTGGSSEDLLLGAWYSLENSTTALAALLSEWTSGSVYADRVAHLLGTLAGGANGSFTLTSTTVKEDNAKDTLTGGSGKDWYLRNSLGATPANRDTTTDIDIDSVFTEIDTWL